MKNIIKNDSIIIKATDTGNGVIIMDLADYSKESETMLNNDQFITSHRPTCNKSQGQTKFDV